MGVVIGGSIGPQQTLTVQDIDGSPLVTGVTKIKFTNGSVTDDGGGVVTINTSAGDITGSGTANTVAKFTGTAAIGNSLLTDDATTLTYSGSGGVKSPFFVSAAANPADAGAVRLGNTETVAWEAATPGTDLTLGVNASDVLTTNAAFAANALTVTTTAQVNGLIQLAGTSASFPALKRNGTFIEARLADDSARAGIRGEYFIGVGSGLATEVTAASGTGFNIGSPTTDGVALITNWAGTNFDRLQLGGATSSFPALKRSTTDLHVRLADDSAFSSVSLLNLTTTATSSTGTAAIIDASNVLRPLTSSLRFKKNVREWHPSGSQMNAFLSLKPILWDYKDNGVKDVVGFSAEGLAKVDRELVNLDNDGLPYSNREHAMLAYLFEIVKRQQRQIAALKKPRI